MEVWPACGTKPLGGEMEIYRLGRDCWGYWWVSGGHSPACRGWRSLSSRDWKHIAAKNRGKVFSSPADVYIGGRRWQYARKSKNSLEQSPEQPHLRLKLTLF